MNDLIIRAKKGDVQAFNEIIPIVEKRLYIVAKAKLYNEEDVLDILQITFIKAFKYLKKLKDDDKFIIWITNILINNCNSFLKKNNKGREISYEMEEIDNYYCTEDSYNAYIEIDDRIDFFELVEFLNEDEKLLLSMYYNEGYNGKQISKILGISENTIRSKIRRAKSKIISRYRLEDEK